MQNHLENSERILNRQIGGLRQYRLDGPARLGYVSENLTALLETDETALLRDDDDGYREFVHPEDRAAYGAFLDELADSEGVYTATRAYRLVTASGRELRVSDTATAEEPADGGRIATSVLTDISDQSRDSGMKSIANRAAPFGFARFTCEEHPRVKYVNDYMLKMMRIPEPRTGELDYLEMYKENIYLIIPIEQRQRFSHLLKRVCNDDTTLSGEMTVMRGDGSRARLFGWIVKTVDENGDDEFQCICIDISERYFAKQESERNRYLKALSDVYDMILEYDFDRGMVKCLHGERLSAFRRMQDIPMPMEEATAKWIEDTVDEADRPRLHAFFRDLFRRRFDNAGKPPQIRYQVRSFSGRVRNYMGVIIKADPTISLFCLRRVPEAEEVSSLRAENTSLKSMKENMERLVSNFSDGIVAFEVDGELVTPLYTSDNVREFFGFSESEWRDKMRHKTLLRELVARSDLDYAEFRKLIDEGEAEFTFYDARHGTERHIKAVCSKKHPDGKANYIMLYNLDDRKDAPEVAAKEVYIRTFGYFDVFINDKPIAFRSEKAKELFALLVDRRGGFVSSEEAISFLWEDEPSSPVVLARYRKVALRLENILEEHDIADVMETVEGKRRLIPEKVRCDLYDYLSGDSEYANLFLGSYLTNYSWGETTLGELCAANAKDRTE